PAQPGARTRVLYQSCEDRFPRSSDDPTGYCLGAGQGPRGTGISTSISWTFLNGKMFYDLAASTWGQEEIDAIRRTIEAGRFTMGEQVAAFEQEFAKYFGMRYGVMVNSGSSANLVAVASLFYKKER